MHLKPPLVAILKTSKLELVQEYELPLEHFPDMVEIDTRQFFRIGITDRKGFYREGVSHRIVAPLK